MLGKQLHKLLDVGKLLGHCPACQPLGAGVQIVLSGAHTSRLLPNIIRVYLTELDKNLKKTMRSQRRLALATEIKIFAVFLPNFLAIIIQAGGYQTPVAETGFRFVRARTATSAQ